MTETLIQTILQPNSPLLPRLKAAPKLWTKVTFKKLGIKGTT